MPKFFVKKKTPKVEKEDFNPVKDLLSWTAPSRPFRKKDRSYFTTIAVIVILLVLIALLAHQFMLVGVILALSFLAYVLASIPPEDVDYKISTQGITIGDHFYFWDDLDSFWLSEKDGHTTLHILTHYRFPGQLILLLGTSETETAKRVVARFLPFHEIPPKSFIDNWAESLQKHFPLENPHR